ncbi:MAG: hypothetical protein LCH77_07315 [Actinobacteria bacterium]|nr:hypothetical protein [Actinomycetota bacterium]
MATISTLPFVRHLRAGEASHIRHLVGGTPKHSGAGAAFWFRPMTAVISQIPVDDRERPILIQVRTTDLQQVAVPGVVTYRVVDPDLAATRVDFSIDLGTGGWTQTPLETMGAVVHGAAVEAVTTALAGLDLRAALTADLGALGNQVTTQLASDPRLTSLGIAIIGIRFALLRPEPDVERALQTPAREAIQQDADRATFERRALAVEKEAAIGENELANQVELARRREQLIAQEGANDRRRAEEAALAAALATQSEADRTRALADAQADSERAVGQAAAEVERARVEAYAEVPRDLLLALAVRQAAENLPAIDHLVITPDLLQGLLAQLTGPRAEVR